MTDPFETLREQLIPLAPRPEFASGLRRRLALALGVTREAQPMKEVREYTPARLRSLTPYLATSDPAAAIAWYTEVFGAQLLGDVGHRETVEIAQRERGAVVRAEVGEHRARVHAV